MKRVAFCNAKSGVGSTTLVYNLAAMFADLGARVLAADLDPQADLTAACVEEQVLARWSDRKVPSTVFDAVAPAIGGGEVRSIEPYALRGEPRVALVPGDIAMSRFEDVMARAWLRALDGDADGERITTTFGRVVDQSAHQWAADIVLIDVGAGCGALSRAALLCADAVVIPVTPDRPALEGLRSIGSSLGRWRAAWSRRSGSDLVAAPATEPLGYVIVDRKARPGAFMRSSELLVDEVREAYARDVLGQNSEDPIPQASDHRLKIVRVHRGLAAMAAEARKPLFLLRPGDGAVGSQQEAVHGAYAVFRDLAVTIAERLGLVLPLLEGRAT